MSPEEKVLSLKSAIASILGCSVISARKLASILGQVISMSLAIGPVAQLHTRSLYHVLVGLGPTSCVCVTSEALKNPSFGMHVCLLKRVSLSGFLQELLSCLF